MKKPEGRGDRNVVTFDTRELSVILFEAMMELKRPPGTTVEEAIETIERKQPDVLEALRRMAEAALGYVVDQLQNSEVERAQ